MSIIYITNINNLENDHHPYKFNPNIVAEKSDRYEIFHWSAITEHHNRVLLFLLF